MLALNRLVSWAGIGTDDDESSSPLAKLFSGERRDPIPLARQGGLPAGIKLHPGGRGDCRSGSAVLDGKPLEWREFSWGNYAVGSSLWHSVRWRFYMRTVTFASMRR